MWLAENIYEHLSSITGVVMIPLTTREPEGTNLLQKQWCICQKLVVIKEMSKDDSLIGIVAGSVFNVYYMIIHLDQMIVHLNLFYSF